MSTTCRREEEYRTPPYSLGTRDRSPSPNQREMTRRLSPGDKIAPVSATPVSATPWRHLPVEIAAALRPRLRATVRAVADAVTESTPAFAALDDAKVQRDLRTAVQVAFERFLDLIGTDEP